METTSPQSKLIENMKLFCEIGKAAEEIIRKKKIAIRNKII